MKQLAVLPQMNGGLPQQKSKKSAFGGIGTGMLSVLMVLIILLLTSFAVLSYATAVAEARLTEKTVQSAADYYAADATAQKALFELDTMADKNDSAMAFLQSLPQMDSVSVSWEVDASGEGYQLTCTIPIDDARQLRMLLTVTEADGRVVLNLTQRRVESTAVWEEEGIYVWDGT